MPTSDGSSTPRCNPTASFGAPVALTSINTDAQDEQANLSLDELTLYFSSTRPGGLGGYDIYQATRLSTALPFGNIVPVTGVNTTGDDREPRVTTDGLSMFAISKPPGATAIHVTLATRTNPAVAFGELQLVATINGTTNDGDPYLLPTGTVLYFASDRGGNFGLYRSTKIGGAFSAPTPVSGVDLDTASIEGNPVVTPDELTLFFASNRAVGSGAIEIYEATRSTVADGFGAPIALTGLNTSGFDSPNWISADGCDLYFTRGEASLGNQLYVAERGW